MFSVIGRARHRPTFMPAIEQSPAPRYSRRERHAICSGHKPRFRNGRHCPLAFSDAGSSCGIRKRARRHRHGGFERTVGGAMTKPSLVSVVEDDRFFRASMKRLMRSRGYRVEVFASAADFLGSSHLGETACLIADVHMPAMTGVELYRRLIDLGHAIPTILVTAYSHDDVRTRALQDGVVCFLRKPIDEEHLLRCLRAALGSAER